jgi:HEAT repeat protein
MRGGILTVVLVLLCSAGTARADKVDLLVKQLARGNYKLRLSAALKLSRFRDERAVAAMVRALRRDDRNTIRRVAALSMSRMVDESLPVSLRKRAIAALKRARSKDRDKKVRENAAASLKKLDGLGSNPNAKVFLHIGKPADLTRSAPRDAPRRMHLAVRRTLRSHAPKYAQDWPTGKLPTKRELERKGAKAFFVGASVSSLRVRKTRGRAEVRCSVSVRVSPWEGRDGKERWRADQTASATGNGKVVGAASRRGIDAAKRDCLLAVVEQITARQVVPFLRKLAN